MGTLADNFYPDGTPISSADVIKRVKQETDTVLVGFSGGKDSIALYLAVKDHFKTVVPFYREFVPGLQFVQRRLEYYERKLGMHVMRVHSPTFFRLISNLVFQPPHRVPSIDLLDLPSFTYEDINDLIIADRKLPENTFVALGVRQADSLQRRATCKSRGAINWERRSFWPIWDYSNDAVGEIIGKNGIGLGPEYEYWGTSFDGLRYFFLNEVRQRYPEDYERILELFPFADMEIMRYNLMGGTYEKQV